MMIIIKCKEIEKIYKKVTGEELMKRELIRLDQTKQIIMTFWQKDAQNFQYEENTIIFVQHAKVSNFYGKSLTLCGSIEIDPKHQNCKILHQWFCKNRNKLVFPSFDKMNISEVTFLSFITVCP